MISVQLPDGKILEVENDATAMSIAKSIGERLANAVIAAKVDETVSRRKSTVEGSSNGEERSTVAAAVNRPRPRSLGSPASLGCSRDGSSYHASISRCVARVGPTTGNGFYYDFDLPHKLNEDDFAAIEAEMEKVVKDAEPFERFALPRDEAVELCSGMKQALKVEHIKQD